MYCRSWTVPLSLRKSPNLIVLQRTANPLLIFARLHYKQPFHVGYVSAEGACLEGWGDLVTKLILGIFGVTKWVIGLINLITEPP